MPNTINQTGNYKYLKMNDFVKFNKINGVYWLKRPINTLTIKINTRPQEGIIQLPRFEEYKRPDATKKIQECTPDETTYKWQEKVFSCHEIEKYSNVHNCVTDTELSYFELLENTQNEGKKIFTYINEDYYKPLPFDNQKEKQSVTSIKSCLGKISLSTKATPRRVFKDGTSSTTHLFRSNENIALESERWMSMHIVYDNSEYTEESQLLLKQESTLLSLYYNATKNYLILLPDVNDLTFNPYTIDGNESGLQYSVEIGYGEEDSSEELVKMLHKLHKKWEKKHKQMINFTSPQLGKKKIYMTFEIVSAKDFEQDNIYVEFHIKIPDDIQYSGTLLGKTHTTSALKTEELKEWKYGHSVDLEMEVSTGMVPSLIKIYLEVISTDWWGRHRTEGYTCLKVPVDPGQYSKTLSCMRPEEMDSVEAESRRFFVGGCHLIKDFGVLENPSQSGNYRWRTTGSVYVRWSTLTQSAMRGSMPSEGGADAALRRYRRAVAALAAARELYTQEPEK